MIEITEVTKRTETTTNGHNLKNYWAAFYASDWARLLLGDSFHPGGLALTRRLGNLLKLQPGMRVLNLAAGRGTSAIFLAMQFDVEVVGVDASIDSVRAARAAAIDAGVSRLVRFVQGSAESLRFRDNSFDAVICECAFCTFPDKEEAAAEISRVLRPGGRLGLSDMTRNGSLPPELETILAWLACFAEAWPVEEYVEFLERTGLVIKHVESHPQALTEMVRKAHTRLLSLEALRKLGKLDLPADIDVERVKTIAQTTMQAVQENKLSYALLVWQQAGMMASKLTGN